MAVYIALVLLFHAFCVAITSSVELTSPSPLPVPRAPTLRSEAKSISPLQRQTRPQCIANTLTRAFSRSFPEVRHSCFCTEDTTHGLWTRITQSTMVYNSDFEIHSCFYQCFKSRNGKTCVKRDNDDDDSRPFDAIGTQCCNSCGGTVSTYRPFDFNNRERSICLSPSGTPQCKIIGDKASEKLRFNAALSLPIFLFGCKCDGKRVGRTYQAAAAPSLEDCFTTCMQRGHVGLSCDSASFIPDGIDCCRDCGGVQYDTYIPLNERNDGQSTFDMFHNTFSTSSIYFCAEDRGLLPSPYPSTECYAWLYGGDFSWRQFPPAVKLECRCQEPTALEFFSSYTDPKIFSFIKEIDPQLHECVYSCVSQGAGALCDVGTAWDQGNRIDECCWKCGGAIGRGRGFNLQSNLGTADDRMCVALQPKASISPVPARNGNSAGDCDLNITASWEGETAAIFYSCNCRDGTSSTSNFVSQDDMQPCLFTQLRKQQGNSCVKWKPGTDIAKGIQERANRICELCGGKTEGYGGTFSYNVDGHFNPSLGDASYCWRNFNRCSLESVYDESNNDYVFPFVRYGSKCSSPDAPSRWLSNTVNYFASRSLVKCYDDCFTVKADDFSRDENEHVPSSCCTKCGGQFRANVDVPSRNRAVASQTTGPMCMDVPNIAPSPSPVCVVAVEPDLGFYNISSISTGCKCGGSQDYKANGGRIFSGPNVYDCYFACLSRIDGNTCNIYTHLEPLSVPYDWTLNNEGCCAECNGQIRPTAVTYNDGLGSKYVWPTEACFAEKDIPSFTPAPNAGIPEELALEVTKNAKGNADASTNLIHRVTDEFYLNVLGQESTITLENDLLEYQEPSARLQSSKSVLANHTFADSELDDQDALVLGKASRAKVERCPTAWCAVRITYTSTEKKIKKDVVKLSIQLLKRRPSFTDIFRKGKKHLKITKWNKGKKYVVIIRFKQSYLDFTNA